MKDRSQNDSVGEDSILHLRPWRQDTYERGLSWRGKDY